MAQGAVLCDADSLCAAALAALVTSPLEVAKTRMQSLEYKQWADRFAKL
jgi:hypothetical protein